MPPVDCVPVGGWVAPGAPTSRKLTASEAISQLASRSVVLLGESHDNAEHHRWQLQTLAALHFLRPDMVIGFEMFPRSVQPALDRWVAGEISEAEFLRESRWRTVWSIDPHLYMPLFHFARMNRVPMLALNVERDLVAVVREKGYDGIAEDQREGVTRPAPPSAGYIDMLFNVYREHARAEPAKIPTRDDLAFRRFVEAQQLWDRAMAEALATALRRGPGALVVGVMGSGHVVHGHGVPHQLRDLGVANVGVALPWDRSEDCARLTSGIADIVFGVAPARRATCGANASGYHSKLRCWASESAKSSQAASRSLQEFVPGTSLSKPLVSRYANLPTSPARFNATRPAPGYRSR